MSKLFFALGFVWSDRAFPTQEPRAFQRILDHRAARPSHASGRSHASRLRQFYPPVGAQ